MHITFLSNYIDFYTIRRGDDLHITYISNYIDFYTIPRGMIRTLSSFLIT